jgi:hypothetical protein
MDRTEGDSNNLGTWKTINRVIIYAEELQFTVASSREMKLENQSGITEDLMCCLKKLLEDEPSYRF